MVKDFQLAGKTHFSYLRILRNGPEVLVLYRKREGARRLHEHGVFARFRYNDLKEAARDAGDAGPMQIQWWEGAASSCAEAVRQSATRDSMSPEAGCCEKGS